MITECAAGLPQDLRRYHEIRRMHTPEPNIPRDRNAVKSRVALIAGFGGLLLLMTFAEADGIGALQRTQTSNDAIREAFLRRTRTLERIRSDLYLSGSYVRDYLLEPDPGKAEGHLDSILETRADMDSAIGEYRSILDPQAAPALEALARELADYWNALAPALRWMPEQRQRDGYAFLRDQVFPRRATILGIADRIGILNESQLNAGRAAAIGLFSRYRRRLALTIGFTVVFGLLLAVFSVRRILRLESEAAQRYREIGNAQIELRRLSARLVEAQEDERRSISRELHDEVGQSLTGVLLGLAQLSTMVRSLPDASEKAGDIKKLAEHSLSAVRNMALLLRPSMLDDLGLVPALEWQAREVSKHTEISVKVDATDVPDDLPEEHRTCVYRLVQESLHNCARHSGASRITVTVRHDPEQLLLSIEDDGRGFDAQRKRGLGLIGMQERVANLGGTLTVKSRQGAGTTVQASLPLGHLRGEAGHA
jgi:signal transduction histidine kinase